MKKIKLRKWVVVLLIFLILVLGALGFYGYLLQPVSKVSEEVTFVVPNGSSKIDIATQLKDAKLVRSKYTLLFYLFFNSDLNLQAGKYTLNRNMKPNEILEKLHKGDVTIETKTFTFVEGKTVLDLAKVISSTFSYTEEEVKNVLKDQDFIQKMIEKYDFLTEDILNGNIYYALEGYLYPDTYELLEDASIEEILTKMLDNTSVKLSGLDFSGIEYSIHDVLTMASIVELEGTNEDDRAKFAQVIYKRLDLGMTLGMDTTAKYVAQMEGKNVNYTVMSPYNTRRTDVGMAGKLPVGPIGNPSLNAIKAVLNPSDTDYIYFVANTCTGKNFFNVDLMEHSKKARELREICATN